MKVGIYREEKEIQEIRKRIICVSSFPFEPNHSENR